MGREAIFVAAGAAFAEASGGSCRLFIFYCGRALYPFSLQHQRRRCWVFAIGKSRLNFIQSPRVIFQYNKRHVVETRQFASSYRASRIGRGYSAEFSSERLSSRESAARVAAQTDVVPQLGRTPSIRKSRAGRLHVAQGCSASDLSLRQVQPGKCLGDWSLCRMIDDCRSVWRARIQCAEKNC